jgi:CRISPR-associated protein Cmr2
MDTTYFALTIGPIYKTFSYSKKTRELWAASFSFSHLMKCLVTEFKNSGDILLPNMEGREDESFEGIGVYPDRLILTVNKAEGFNAELLISKALISFCDSIKFGILDAKKYFQIYHVTIDSEGIAKIELPNAENNKSNIHKLNHLLNCKELQPHYNPNNLSILPKLFRWDTLQNSYELSFGAKKYSFNSLEAIAAKDVKEYDTIKKLLNKDEEKYTDAEKEIISNIPFKKYHNYIAILHGDGDNFGEVISSLGNDVKAIKVFSKKLIDYSLEAAKKIKNYGGDAIYIGGDDIMCFAPVKNGEKTIFHLIDEINTCFKSFFINGEYNGIAVSLSYGLSITYSKYPLNEALKKSYDLMKDEAKNKKLNPGKNGIAIEVLLHSGQQRKILLNFKAGGNYEKWMKMLNTFNNQDEIIQSITHLFIEDEEMLISLCKSDNYEDRLYHYFNYHFNIDDSHSMNYTFTNAVYNYFIAELKMDATKIKDKEYILIAMNKANTACRLINFLNNQS